MSGQRKEWEYEEEEKKGVCVRQRSKETKRQEEKGKRRWIQKGGAMRHAFDERICMHADMH